MSEEGEIEELPQGHVPQADDDEVFIPQGQLMFTETWSIRGSSILTAEGYNYQFEVSYLIYFTPICFIHIFVL
jgi:hypothetical protein